MDIEGYNIEVSSKDTSKSDSSVRIVRRNSISPQLQHNVTLETHSLHAVTKPPQNTPPTTTSASVVVATTPTTPVQQFEISEGSASDTSLSMSCVESDGAKKFIFFLVVMCAALVCILVPMSFSDLHYYELGFEKSKISGSVDTSTVYKGGRHFLGLFVEFKKFRADMHYESFKNIAIFNKEKLEVLFSCSLLYKLRPAHLSKLHDTYDLHYRPIIRSTTLATLKGVATQFAVDEYRMEREKVRKAFSEEVAKQLGGNCCAKDCTICPAGCLPLDTCNELGLFVEVRYFHLHMVGITSEQESRYLKQVVETEKKDTELYKQEESMKRIETDQLSDEIKNEANEVREKAIADSDLVKANATIDAKRITSDAANQGLQIIYSKLNITSGSEKKSLDYIRTLVETKVANIYVGFDYMVASKATP